MPTPKKSAVKVTVDVDKNLKHLWEAEARKLTQASKGEASSWDDRYEAIAAILEHEPPLYLAGGFSTDADFIKKVVREDKSSLYRNLRVAKYANPSEVELYTVSKLDLAIAIVETRNHGPLKGRTPIAFEKLRFPFLDGTETVTRSFPDMTVGQLRSALALARGRDVKSKNASPAAKRIAAALKASGVKGVTFSVSTKTCSLRVPLEGLGRVAKALSGWTAPT